MLCHLSGRTITQGFLRPDSEGVVANPALAVRCFEQRTEVDSPQGASTVRVEVGRQVARGSVLLSHPLHQSGLSGFGRYAHPEHSGHNRWQGDWASS
jgi:hypothetical protein